MHFVFEIIFSQVCPDAKYSCAGDDDLLQFKDVSLTLPLTLELLLTRGIQYLSADWLAFPALLRKLKPEVVLSPDGRESK